ncbi:nucleotidyltransferase family protein [bacterium]
MKEKEVIILAGGLGTRLRSVVNDIPKVMAQVNGKPFLEYTLDYLNSQNMTRVILSVGYKYDIIQNYFKDRFKNIELVYSIESEPLGTGGALKKALELTANENIFFMNGDTFFGIDLDKLENCHLENNSICTIALKYMENCDRYGTVKVDENRKIISIQEKKIGEQGFINAGVYLVNKKIFSTNKIVTSDIFSFEKDYLEPMYTKKAFYGCEFDSYFIDIGVPEDYEKIQNEYRNLFLTH